MNREQIDLVRQGWIRASTEPDVLQAAILDRLPGTLRFRLDRAGWIIEAVTRLAPTLDRPATFIPLAGDLLALRVPVTMDELAIERKALLGALDDVVATPMSVAERAAWELAIGLFAEIVSSVCLDPFGARSTSGKGQG
jgi:hypothetical protein